MSILDKIKKSKSFKEFLEEITIDESMPNIGDCSLSIANKEYHLTKIFDKHKKGKILFLGLKNITLITQANTYAAFLQIFKEDQESSNVFNELKEAHEESIKVLIKLADALKDEK